MARLPILSLCLTLVVALTVDRLGGLACKALLTHSKFRVSAIYTDRIQTDFLVAGNSRAMHAFNAVAISNVSQRRCFNISYNGLSSRTCELLIEDALSHNPAPKVLLCEISVLFHHTESQGGTSETDLKPYACVSPQIRSWLKRERPIEAACAQLSHLYAFNSELFFRAVFCVHQDDQGYGMTRTIPSAVARSETTMDGRRLPYSKSTVDDLHRVCQAAAARGVKVRLILAPYHRAFMVDHPELSAIIRDFERLTRERVWDFSAALEGDEWFADRIHLNTNGAAKFAEILLRSGCLDLEG